ncbi:fimbrial protein [Dyella sp. 2RAB6]|uniref:fimbrial protein n=1 Tax=Dyella sp. 2RAB6 TaxID=3232992 RepID=UPI003F92F2C7
MGLTVLFIIALVKAPAATAATTDCTQSGYPAAPSTATVGAIKIPSDLPVGSPIPGTRVALNWSFSCKESGITGGGHWSIMNNKNWTAKLVPGLINVYQLDTKGSATEVAGIGFRFLNSAGTPVSFDATSVYTNDVVMGDAPAKQTSFRWNGYIELVRINATVATGTGNLWFYTGVAGQAYGNINEASSKFTYKYSISSTADTCSVVNPTQTVTLPTVSSATASLDATGVTQRAGSTPFTISLKCSGGSKLSMTFTDANNPGNRTNIVKAAEASADYGIGLTYLDPTGGPKSVSLGPESAAAGVDGQINIGSTIDGTTALRFFAAYAHSPGTKFPPGPVSAKAIFTLSYQ